jgi:hypothetical protein
MDTRSGWSRFARVGMALAFGFMTGSLEALTRDAEGMRFDLGIWTVVAFLAGAAVGWFYWEMAMKMNTDAEHSSARAKRRFIAVTALLFVGGFASYLYRLRFVSRASSWEVAEGVVMAFVVVGAIGLVMWRIGRYLEGK